MKNLVCSISMARDCFCKKHRHLSSQTCQSDNSRKEPNDGRRVGNAYRQSSKKLFSMTPEDDSCDSCC